MARWIKIHRKILEWEWFTDSTTLKLFIYMLFRASYKEYKIMGKTYPAGSFVCLRESLEQCGLTPMQVRRSLEKLKSTGEITTKTLGHATLFNITKWSDYQTKDNPNQNDTQDIDYQCDTFDAPINDDQTEDQTNAQTKKAQYPNQNDTQNAQYQYDTRQVNHIDNQTQAQTDAQRDNHSDAHSNNIEYVEDSLNAHTHTHTHTRIREDGDIPNAPYNPSQGYGAPPVIPYPKTAKEVIDAATMQGVPMTSEDAQDFLDRNEALGWLINNQPIRDWRRMLRGWINKANQYRRTHNNGNRQQQRFDTKHVPRADEYGEGDAF